ncbi:hypothetical protein [Melaminivora sp.]|uniref:hypothetical protein n=1 Tax=Melaminivora sp. TaxID=1933032 RepID=UPI0028A6FB02|nr:hypothetical protein [Melaminivora sp.]
MTAPRRRQRGIATVLIVLLVGLTLTAGVLGTVAHVRSLQEQDVATHAQTQAQVKAWLGADLVRQYLERLQQQGQFENLKAQGAAVLTFAGGVDAGVLGAEITKFAADGSVHVQVTGVGAPGTRAEARSVLQVVYDIEQARTAAPAQPLASAVFRGDVNISGGTTSFNHDKTPVKSYEKIAVDGRLNIGSASQAKISGCAKGDINLSGGGIDENAELSSQNGSITIAGMSPPKNASLWGRSIHVGNSGSGSYRALKAGAYQTNLLVGPVVVGTTAAGGTLLPGTAGPGVPWATGTVLPWPAGHLVVTLTDGSKHLLDMRRVQINGKTGAVTDARAAVVQLSGRTTTEKTEFPDSFLLQSTAINGGGIDLYSLKVAQTWGYHIAMKGYGGEYEQVWPAGNLEVVTAVMEQLRGGGDLWATAGGCSSPGNCWNVPTVRNKSPIAGKIYYGSGKAVLTGNFPGIEQQKTNTSPGLPGVPFCDTRVSAFDAAAYRSQANYIFEFDLKGQPRLTIQHVKLRRKGQSNGDISVDKADIDLLKVDPVGTPLANMTLRRMFGEDFLGCNNQSPANPSVDALACLRSATPTTGWHLRGITKFPPGIALFIGPVIIDGVASSQGVLYNTLLATGSITLTGSGHGPLVAPNFARPVTSVCGGPFYPANLCSGEDKLVTYFGTDSQGITQKMQGLPLANLATATNASFIGNSWDGVNGLKGHVIIGEGFQTGGATIRVEGTITVGVNQRSNTVVQQGGFQLDTTGLSEDQQKLPPPPNAVAGPGQVRLKWARYQ